MNVTVLAVIGIVGLCVASSVAFVAVVLWTLRRASRDRGAEVRAAHPDAEIGPELGQYRGGTGDFPRTRNTSWIVLTPATLVVRPILGKTVTLPVTEVVGTRMATSFKGHRNGLPVLVLETGRGEIGLTVDDPEQWRAALLR